jgi:hypothetical protein
VFSSYMLVLSNNEETQSTHYRFYATEIETKRGFLNILLEKLSNHDGNYYSCYSSLYFTSFKHIHIILQRIFTW